MQICSMGREWVDLSVIINIMRAHGLTDEEIKMILNFLIKYFLELDESGRKVRATKGFFNLYGGNS